LCLCAYCLKRPSLYYVGWDVKPYSLTHSRSLSLIPGQGGGWPPLFVPGSPKGFMDWLWCCLLAKCPSWSGLELDSRTHCLVGTLTAWAGGRLPAPNTVKVGCYQRRVTSMYLRHRDALVPGPVTFSAPVSVFPVSERSMDPGMRIAEVLFLSDTLLMPWPLPPFLASGFGSAATTYII